MKIRNLTPHSITLRAPDGTETVIPPEPIPARVTSTPGVRLHRAPSEVVLLHQAPTWGEVEGLPSPESDTIFVVSMLVAARCGGRHDVYSPGTGPADGAIRDKGRIAAVTRLIQAPAAR